MPESTSSFEERFQQALEAEKQRRKAEGRGNWGDLSPEWVNQKRLEMMLAETTPGTTAGGFTGVDYGYFTDMLKKSMEQGDPNQQLYRQNIQGGIDKSFDTQQRTLRQNLAQSGNLRSGAGDQAVADIEAGRSSAVGQSEVALASQ
ncbi:hypothetical protein, partial [Methanoregula sp.]|uniref:hypothetical protein n=1 Tax=Methanoregula sp. TaxID=2052170 RepID=UPI003568984B